MVCNITIKIYFELEAPTYIFGLGYATLHLSLSNPADQSSLANFNFFLSSSVVSVNSVSSA